MSDHCFKSLWLIFCVLYKNRYDLHIVVPCHMIFDLLILVLWTISEWWWRETTLMRTLCIVPISCTQIISPHDHSGQSNGEGRQLWCEHCVLYPYRVHRLSPLIARIRIMVKGDMRILCCTLIDNRLVHFHAFWISR